MACFHPAVAMSFKDIALWQVSAISPAMAVMIVIVDMPTGVIIDTQGRVIVIVIVAMRITMGPIVDDDAGIQQSQGRECQDDKCKFYGLV
jgi:hypothetical protein